MGRRGSRREVWGVVAGTTMALGLACAVVVWGLWGPVTTCLAMALTAFLVAVLAGKSLWTSTRLGVRLGLVLVAGGGLVAAFGWLGVLLVVVITATSPLARILVWTGRFNPWLRRGLLRDEAALRDDSAPAGVLGVAEGGVGGSAKSLVLLADMPDAGDMLALDDPALCQAWRRSYVRLQGSRGADTRLAVVSLRQVYLDELMRRHPAEVRQWFASGARAAGNPLPYLKGPVRPERSSEDGQPDGPGSEAA